MTRQAESEHDRSSDDADIRPLGATVSSGSASTIKPKLDLLCLKLEPGYSPSSGEFTGIAAMRFSMD